MRRFTAQFCPPCRVSFQACNVTSYLHSADTVSYIQADLPIGCIGLPNPNIPHDSDPVSLYSQTLQALMTESVKTSIRYAHKATSALDKDPNTGGFYIMPEKKDRAPYDDYLRDLTRQYGTNTRFRSGPQFFDQQLLSVLAPQQEYIFGITMDKQLFILPRREILCIDDVFYEGRHTHREFLMGKYNQSLLAAGTLFVSRGTLAKTVGYNLRTGHFGCHKDTKENRAALMDMTVDKLRMQANNTHHGFFVRPSKEKYYPLGSGPNDRPVETQEVVLVCK